MNAVDENKLRLAAERQADALERIAKALEALAGGKPLAGTVSGSPQDGPTYDLDHGAGS